MTTKATPVKVAVMMNKTRAREIIKIVSDSLTEAGDLLLELRDQEGWRALGYTSFKACCERELEPHFGSRSQVYRLMEQAEVSANVGKPVPITHAPILNQLPAEAQADALKEATKAGRGKATTETVAAAVEARVEPPKAAPKAPAKVAKKNNAKYEKAVERIGVICGKDVRKALEQGALKLNEKEVIYWAGLEDDEMADIQELVVSKRWFPTKAHKFRSRMVGPKTTVEELQSHAAAEGGTWEGTVGGYKITVTETGKRK